MTDLLAQSFDSLTNTENLQKPENGTGSIFDTTNTGAASDSILSMDTQINGNTFDNNFDQKLPISNSQASLLAKVTSSDEPIDLPKMLGTEGQETILEKETRLQNERK